ncbi:ROK family transcriptional regulator [Jeotgalibacillus alimentarius]|uniref:ROK family transcriptional regulator n=1 Tax=Jeotgalibacillus alimentarius TaxID=135826 RepID=A0A0C2RMU8_9BACL|nr:ROK family protein [Jeotgalibacillus alimentarius]KIL51565.1 ROK family transcriptional regulator [Jeotgalibacillus alimentarius]
MMDQHTTDFAPAAKTAIRKKLLQSGGATKVELNRTVEASFPTISKLITEMEKDGEIMSLGLDESSGGRRAERYVYNADYMLGLAVLMEGNETRFTVFNCAGEVKDEGSSASFLKGNGMEPLTEFIEKMCNQHSAIKTVSIGVPGAVDQGRVIFIPGYDQFQKMNVKQDLETRFPVRAVVENDMNAAVLGYQHADQKQSLVYLYAGQNGPGSGVLVNGEVVRGSTYFAGEIQFVPQQNDQNFGENLSGGRITSDGQIDAVSRLVAAFTAMINPHAVIFNQHDIDEASLEKIASASSQFIPAEHLPELKISNWEQDYLNGLQKLGIDLLLTLQGGQ